MQETPTQYIMWRFAGSDDKESIEFSVDEESARSVKWCIDGVTGSARPCIDPKCDAKKAKTDEAGAMVPEATMNCRQKQKEKIFEFEEKWQFKVIEANVWLEKDILIKMYRDVLQRRGLDVSYQIASMGANWVKVDFKEDGTRQRGYAKESSAEFQEATASHFFEASAMFGQNMVNMFRYLHGNSRSTTF